MKEIIFLGVLTFVLMEAGSSTNARLQWHLNVISNTDQWSGNRAVPSAYLKETPLCNILSIVRDFFNVFLEYGSPSMNKPPYPGDVDDKAVMDFSNIMNLTCWRLSLYAWLQNCSKQNVSPSSDEHFQCSEASQCVREGSSSPQRWMFCSGFILIKSWSQNQDIEQFLI